MPRGKSPRDATLPARRREDLLQIVQQAGQATVSELAERFEVSLDTIRRDIDHLAELGMLARTHGGAIPVSALATADTPLGKRMQAREEIKRLIGQAAAGLIHDNETVIMNGGTTTLAVAAALGGRSALTIVTNNLLLPATVPAEAVRDIYLLGGGVRLGSMTTTGPVRFPGSDGGSSHTVSADVAVIGVGGISADRGLSTSNLPDAQMMREMISCAGRLIVVADATKVGHNAFAHIGPLEKIDTLVCDLDADDPVAVALADAGGELVAVP